MWNNALRTSLFKSSTSIYKSTAFRTLVTSNTTLYARNYNLRNNKPSSKVQLKPLNFIIPNYISVDKLANLLNCRVNTLIKDLTRLGFANVTHNYILSKEYVELILQEYSYDLPNSTEDSVDSSNVYELLKAQAQPNSLEKRPPVVTIMGHIDHGKTTIIDYLRKSSVVAQEHGGITQHIGAFQIITPESKKKITFLDTPGHAAFLKMRERGANITDIIVLVISIEDSIMPQTIEAIKHIKQSGNELIVAITKIDRISNLNERERLFEKVSNDLIVNEISIEKIGGEVQVIPISAKTGENMDLLEESIVLLSDIMDIRAENSKKTLVEGWVLESQVKKMKGNVATMLVKKGTLQKGKVLLCGNTYCKVKNLLNDANKPILQALPSQSVTVLGWKELPKAGDEILEVTNEATAKKYIAKRLALQEVEKDLSTVEKLNEQRAIEIKEKDNKFSEKFDVEETEEPTGPKNINFIVKADVSGSAEAIKDSISCLGNEEVKCHIISTSVGIPNDSDLKMAQITGSRILCFNLGSLPNDVISNKSKIEVKQYNVIYKLIEDVTEILTDSLTPIYEKKRIASVDIREIFSYTLKKKDIRIAGCKVNNGKISRNSLVQILRGPEEKVVYEGKLSSLKQGKEDASEVSKGKECGVTFENNLEDYKKGDKIIVYEEIKVQRFL